MKSRLIEATQGHVLWSKFHVMQPGTAELAHESVVSPGRPLLQQVGMSPYSLLVIDLGTQEGFYVSPGVHAGDVLRRHQVAVSPMMEPFLKWLLNQQALAGKTFDVTQLPDRVELKGGGPTGRQDGPLPALLKECMKSTNREMQGMARRVWTSMFGDAPAPNVPITLDQFKEWMSRPPVR